MSDLETTLVAPNGCEYKQPLGLFINNTWTLPTEANTFKVISPIDGKLITSVHAASSQDVDLAVTAARAAFNNPSWRDIGSKGRATLLYKLADLAEANAELFATVDTWNNGKPYKSALGDVSELASVCRYYAGFADKMYGQTIETSPQKLAYTIREPLGVCGQIIPWNYPLGMLSWKIAPALACGNTILVKPAEQTPLSALLFANLVVEAGFPPGVINIINGLGNIAGAAMASHPDVDKISFTGSTATGKEVMKLASGTLKNVTLETGGKSPLLVLKDADLDLAVTHAHYGVMGNQGQICTSTSRILVHDSVFDDFMQKLLAHTGRVSIVGDPFDERTFQGPQVSKKQYDSILTYGKIGIQEGAKLECGGSAEKAVDGGFFIQPTIFSGVTESMRIYREEIFGPFAVVCRFDTEDQALRMANGLTYGLSAAVFTNDLSRAHHLARRLEAGMVWINSSQDSDYRIPFGGVKQSGVGRELGQAGLDAYCNIKSVHVNIGSDPYK